MDIPVKVTAGPHKVAATFIARTYAESDDVLHQFRPGAGEDRIPKIGSLEIQGPFNPTGVERDAEPRRIFVCRPKTQSEELPCARTILSSLARKAYRRPITEADSRRRSASTAPRAEWATSTRRFAMRCRRFSRARSSCIVPSDRRQVSHQEAFTRSAISSWPLVSRSS